MRRAEGEAADAVHHGLNRHHREAREERDAAEEEQGGAIVLRSGGDLLRSLREPRAPDGEEGRTGHEVDDAHGDHAARESERRNEEEARAQRAEERARGVEGVHPCVKPGRIVEVAREALGEEWDGSAHEHGGGADQHDGEHDVARKHETGRFEGNPQR